MDKNLPSMDEIFNEAHQGYEADPSPDVWEKIEGGLDKEQAAYFKRRFIIWRRMAIVLLFLFLGLTLFEATQKKVEFTNQSAHNQLTQKGEGKAAHKLPTQKTTISTTDRSNSGDITINQSKVTSNSMFAVPLSNEKEHKRTNVTTALDITTSSITSKRKKVSNNIVQDGVVIIPNTSFINHSNTSSYNQQVTSKKELEKTEHQKVNASLQELKHSVNNIDHAILLQSKSISLIPLSAPYANSFHFVNEKKRKKASKMRWSFTAFGSKDWVKYQLDNDLTNSTTGIDDKNIINSRENAEACSSFGLYVRRQVAGFIGIKTGLLYAVTNIAINPERIAASQQANGTYGYKYNTSSGYTYLRKTSGSIPMQGDTLQTAVAQLTLNTVSVPLMVTYNIPVKGFSITPGIGITVNYITRAKIVTETTDATGIELVTIDKLSGTKKMYTGFIADVSFAWYYNRHFDFTLAPTFKKALTPITKNNVVKTFPNCFGISAGLTYHF